YEIRSEIPTCGYYPNPQSASVMETAIPRCRAVAESDAQLRRACGGVVMDAGSSRRTRVVNGCQACRARHVKCDERIPSCESCTKDGIECVRATSIRFRGFNKSGSEKYSFPEDQTWLQSAEKLTYLDETNTVSRWYEGPDYLEADHDDPWPDARDQTGIDDSICARPRNTTLTQREAVLMRNFTDNMALWAQADITDRGRNFETEVPRRALFHSTLRYAIFAFSSRHINRHRRGQESTEALEYYDKCLNLLIPTISNPENYVSEEIFAAVAILRQYEEMDSEDRGLHLTGTTRIVNSMRDWGFTPGLREASAWLCLRQDIYISMVQQSPLKTDLEAFLQSDIYSRDDDMAYAARIVVIVARILLGTAVEDVESRNRILDEARLELEGWHESRPATFNPTWVGPGSGENIVRKHLRSIIGLANSNQGAENLLFMARHALSVWGGVLVDEADQQAVRTFLRHMQQTTSWNTEPMVASLQEQWDEF
ncbi:hypothetical protein LA080_008767, partial [Diaporthe eres]